MSHPLSETSGAIWARARTISVKFKPEDKARLQAAADRAEVPLATYIRELVLRASHS